MMKLERLAVVILLAIGLAISATQGFAQDTDLDGILDMNDTCTLIPNNPPAGVCDQTDSDNDDIGDVCDADYNQDDIVNGFDFGPWFTSFLAGMPVNAVGDFNCDGYVSGTDYFGFLEQLLQGVPGPGIP